MATVVSTVFAVGTKLNLKYPMNGTRNILVCRSGVVENSGIGPAGPYVQMRLTTASSEPSPTSEWLMQPLVSCACLGIIESLIVVVTLGGSWVFS